MRKIILIIGCCCVVAGLLAQPNITRVEYFFNTDTGFGKGASVPITAANNLSNISFRANINSLPIGLNTLFVRSRDATGKWSLTNRFLFVRLSANSSPSKITRAEYFVDTDPGFGLATNIPISTSPDISDVTVGLDIAPVSIGLHTLFIRSKDANGLWSVTNRFLFVKLRDNTIAPNITLAEYYIDTDPGFGKATAIPVTPAANLSDLAVNVDMTSVSEGLHTLFIRSKSADGKWSVTNRWLFVKIAAGTTDITDVEYFIDSDPGFGKAVPVAINASPTVAEYISPVNITGLAIGAHRLFIRSKNSIGKWSITNKIGFPIAALVATPAINVNAITSKVMCGDRDFKLSFHATGTYNVGNIFTVQLSNANGSFAAPTTVGTVTATVSSIVNCKIPLHISNGNAYRVRVVSSNPAFTGATSDTLFSLFNQPRFSDSTVYIVCETEKVNLTTIYNTTGFTTLWNTLQPASSPSGSYQLISGNTNLCKDTAIVIVKQDIATWKGITSKNWHTATNWSTGRVPSEKTHVIIVAGTPNICELSASDISISSIQVKPGAVMNVINSRQVLITAKCNPLPN